MLRALLIMILHGLATMLVGWFMSIGYSSDNVSCGSGCTLFDFNEYQSFMIMITWKRIGPFLESCYGKLVYLFELFASVDTFQLALSRLDCHDVVSSIIASPL